MLALLYFNYMLLVHSIFTILTKTSTMVSLSSFNYMLLSGYLFHNNSQYLLKLQNYNIKVQSLNFILLLHHVLCVLNQLNAVVPVYHIFSIFPIHQFLIESPSSTRLNMGFGACFCPFTLPAYRWWLGVYTYVHCFCNPNSEECRSFMKKLEI